MTQVNSCLKWFLIFFNIAYAIIGFRIIVHPVQNQFCYANRNLALDVHALKEPEFYMVGSIVMVIGILGATAAHMEGLGCMILFLVYMSFGSLTMLIPGSLAAVDHSKLPAVVEAKYHLALPLDNTTDEMRHQMESIQTHGSKLPKTAIYAEACLPIMKKVYLTLAGDFIILCFTLGILGLLGTVLSSVMIYQLCRPNGPVAARMSGAAYFADPPPKYEDLQNVVPSNN